MSYREENGQIVLTMSREDYTLLLLELGSAMATHMIQGDAGAGQALAFLNRLNEGSPTWQQITAAASIRAGAAKQKGGQPGRG